MISTKTMVMLTPRLADRCPHEWFPVNALQRCRATGDAHLCVGDAWHRGKHVCPCGALVQVLL